MAPTVRSLTGCTAVSDQRTFSTGAGPSSSTGAGARGSRRGSAILPIFAAAAAAAIATDPSIPTTAAASAHAGAGPVAALTDRSPTPRWSTPDATEPARGMKRVQLPGRLAQLPDPQDRARSQRRPDTKHARPPRSARRAARRQRPARDLRLDQRRRAAIAARAVVARRAEPVRRRQAIRGRGLGTPPGVPFWSTTGRRGPCGPWSRAA